MMTSPMISICVLDDHPVFAEGIRRVADTCPDISCAGVAATPAELDGLIASSQPDVAILDVRLDGANGIDVCTRLRQRFPAIRVLMLSSMSDPAVARRALAAGASGFAVKSIKMDMLPAAIRMVHEGGIFLSSELITGTLPQLSNAQLDMPLTAREREIAMRIAEGKSNKEIARDLALSSHTVKLHVSRLLKRFNFRSRSQLASLPGL